MKHSVLISFFLYLPLYAAEQRPPEQDSIQALRTDLQVLLQHVATLTQQHAAEAEWNRQQQEYMARRIEVLADTVQEMHTAYQQERNAREQAQRQVAELLRRADGRNTSFQHGSTSNNDSDDETPSNETEVISFVNTGWRQFPRRNSGRNYQHITG